VGDKRGRSFDWRYHARLLGLALLGAFGMVVAGLLIVMLGLSLGIWHIQDH
jgi:hypothetical protein